MRSINQVFALLLSAATLVSALPAAKKREQLYPYPDLGRIEVEKREELYQYPDLGRIEVEKREEKREELYPYPDLGRIEVE